MATVTNLTKWSLYSTALKQSVPAHTTVTGVDDDIAGEACSSGVFVLNYEDESATPVRQVRTRGSKRVETTGGPKVETR